MRLLLSFLLLSGLAWAQQTPDYAKEGRWAAQVDEALMDGDSVWIENGDREFLALLTLSESETKKTAVVVHGLGIHPDWAQVVQPLRVGLTEHGFNTLSIQMPVLANGIAGSEYAPLFGDADKRLGAAAAFLQAQGLEVDALVAHSLGAQMSAHYLANNTHPFKRFVAVGMSKGAAQYLAAIDVPIFDLYGDEDIEPVMQGVKLKADAAKDNKNYRQKMVSADHFFNEKDALLIDEVSAWLQ